MIVELEDDVAHAIQEKPIVGHHQQRLVATVQIAFQPLNHVEIKMVGGLVEND